MANLYNKQANLYALARPTYPEKLFEFIASKTPKHDLAWDVGTGSGQSAVSVAKLYKNVIATDTSLEQLSFAPKVPNIRYHLTPPIMSLSELEARVSSQASVDVVTVAQAVHWFDLSNFYTQVKWILRHPDGVLAVWGYNEPRVDASVDAVFMRIYAEASPFWVSSVRVVVDDKYKNMYFPFEPVHGEDHTGPFEYESVQYMDLQTYITYIRSWSAYQTAIASGIDLLRDEVIRDLKLAWGGDGSSKKRVYFPIHFRIGRVGNE